MLEIGRRGIGHVVEPAHVELQSIRKSCATRRDLALAHAAFAERERAAQQAAHAANYAPPPRTPSLSARGASWLGGPGE